MTDSPPGPRLCVVGNPASPDEEEGGERPSAAESATLAPGPRRSGRTRSLLWLAVLVWLGLLLAYEFRYAGQLEVRVEELSAELGQAREALGVYQRQVGLVRSNLDDLASRVEALQELVREDAFPVSRSVPQAGED